MKTLSDLISQLDSVIEKLQINSVEVQSLKMLLANAAYIDESESLSIAVESNPLTCINLNSAIMHACAKNYSVFRGKNPRYRLINFVATETRSVKKYDEFLSIQGYKLVYAQNYNFVVNNKYNIDLIFTKEVIFGSFDSPNEFVLDITSSDISEDFFLYTLDSYQTVTELPHYSEIDNEINDSKIYAFTISDFGVKLLNLGAFNEYTRYYYRYLPYIIDDENFDEIVNGISRVPYFEFDGSIEDHLEVNNSSSYPSDSYTKPKISREENKDKIYLLSTSQSGGVIKSTDSLDKICLKYLVSYVSKIKSKFTLTGSLVSSVILYYQLANPSIEIPSSLLSDLLSYIKVTYYNPDLQISLGSFVKAVPDTHNYELKIKYKSNSGTNYTAKIVEALKELQSTILGGEFNFNLITPKILSISSDIVYVTLSSNEPSQESTLQDNEYPQLIDLNTNYFGAYFDLTNPIESI